MVFGFFFSLSFFWNPQAGQVKLRLIITKLRASSCCRFSWTADLLLAWGVNRSEGGEKEALHYCLLVFGDKVSQGSDQTQQQIEGPGQSGSSESKIDK